MIEPPPTSVPPTLGPLRAPDEQELVAAYPTLRNQALTLSWASVAYGCQAAQLLALARGGELLVIPGPWPMRQADYPGVFVPAWQHAPGGRGTCPELPAVIAAAASADWTSLDLHRFMTTPLPEDGTTPADLLHAGANARVVALIRSAAAVRPAQTAPTRPGPRNGPAAAQPHRTGSRRLVPPAAGPARPPREDASPPAGPRPGRRRPAAARDWR